MDTFYIDRQFGTPIYVEVEKGIVQSVTNESETFINKMMELYEGKTILFLKEDFERKMRGSYHNVRSSYVVHCIREVHAIGTRIKSINNKLNDRWDKVPEDERILLEERREEYVIEESKSEIKLETEKKRIFDEHKFGSLV